MNEYTKTLSESQPQQARLDAFTERKWDYIRSDVSQLSKLHESEATLQQDNWALISNNMEGEQPILNNWSPWNCWFTTTTKTLIHT